MTSHNFGRTFKKPMRPYEKERIHNELKVCGDYGLKNKRELWRVHYSLAKIRKAARNLLMLPETDVKRKFEGAALLRRLTRLGVLEEDKRQLDYVLSLTTQNLLDRRLQTLVQKAGLAKSIHQARAYIFERHIAVGPHLINQPGFLVWKDNESGLRLSDTSVLEGEKLGRKKRIRAKKKDNRGEVSD
jgi:small subunit ribosomal protein S9e